MPNSISVHPLPTLEAKEREVLQTNSKGQLAEFSCPMGRQGSSKHAESSQPMAGLQVQGGMASIQMERRPREDSGRTEGQACGKTGKDRQ